MGRGARSFVTMPEMRERGPDRLTAGLRRVMGARTRWLITGHGEVYNPIFRLMARFVFSPTATIRRYLAGLEAVERGGSGSAPAV
jgi:hypothetical protein